MPVSTYKVRTAMKRSGLSLRKLEALSGVHRDTLIDLRHGRRKPHPGTIARVAAALGLSNEMLPKGPPQKKRKAA